MSNARWHSAEVEQLGVHFEVSGASDSEWNRCGWEVHAGRIASGPDSDSEEVAVVAAAAVAVVVVVAAAAVAVASGAFPVVAAVAVRIVAEGKLKPTNATGPETE
jgi:hypothetical protein